MPPSYIRVRAVVWAYGRGKADRQTHTDARDHNTFCVVYDSRKIEPDHGDITQSIYLSTKRSRVPQICSNLPITHQQEAWLPTITYSEQNATEASSDLFLL